MSLISVVRSIAIAVCLSTSLWLAAQATPAPTAYAYVATNNFVGTLVVHAQRDGNRALVQLTSASDPKRLNLKNYYDLTAHRVYSADLNSGLCTTVAYTSPYPPPMNDVVAMSDDMRKQLAQGHLQGTPGEVIAGQATEVYEVAGEEASMKVWLDRKYGIPMRYVMTLKGKPPMIMVEISEIRFTAPPATTFTFPTGCKQLSGTTDANGGHVEEKY